jgi:outer membrane biosynthesis protein TonB
VPHSSHPPDAAYRQRLLGAVVCVLVACLLLVHGWPVPTNSESSELPFSSTGQEVIDIEEIIPTRQSQELRPPPPAPLPPVVVPNDRLIEVEVELGSSALQIETPGEDARKQEGTADPVAAARVPDTGARLLRAVQPGYPSAARDAGLRARVVVEVYVDKQGRVETATIKDRWRLDAGGAHPVAELGYGVEEAALTAARRSLFRPARANGQPVATRTTLTFTFGS